MKAKTGVSLAIMMFLEYFVWGAWYVTMGTYMKVNLGVDDDKIGQAYSALAIATIISPFIVEFFWIYPGWNPQPQFW